MLIFPVCHFASSATCKPGNYDSTTLLLHMDGSDGGTTFTDSSSSGLSPTVNGNAQTDTDRFRFGTAAMLLDGTGDYLEYANNTVFEFGSGDFTMDCWVYPTGSAEAGLVALGWFTGANGEWVWRLSNADASSMHASFSYYDAGIATASGVTGAVSKNQWSWVGIKRSGTTLSLWLNGSQDGSNHTIGTSSLGGNSDPLYVGASNLFTHAGSIDELRIVKGSAEDLSSVPTLPYCDS